MREAAWVGHPARGVAAPKQTQENTISFDADQGRRLAQNDPLVEG
jgi:hypothetical protein